MRTFVTIPVWDPILAWSFFDTILVLVNIGTELIILGYHSGMGIEF